MTSGERLKLSLTLQRVFLHAEKRQRIQRKRSLIIHRNIFPYCLAQEKMLAFLSFPVSVLKCLFCPRPVKSGRMPQIRGGVLPPYATPCSYVLLLWQRSKTEGKARQLPCLVSRAILVVIGCLTIRSVLTRLANPSGEDLFSFGQVLSKCITLYK